MKMTIEQFKKYFKEYYENLPVNKEDIDEVINLWNYYKEKIDNNTLSCIEYNSIKDNFDSNSKQYSLQYFIEKGSDILGGFGTMISSNLVLWVEGIKQNLVYHNCKDSNKDNRPQITESEAQELLEEILLYLQNLFKQQDIDDVISYMNNQSLTKSFIQKAFLEKMLVFNSWTNTNINYKNKLIFIYNFAKGEVLELLDDKRHNVLDFLMDKKIENIKKNYKLTDKLLEILEIKNPTIYELNKIGRCYWSLSGSKDRDLLLNNEIKNIIFYGPPGTGKTYSVRKILDNNPDIICKYVQFHPSFTYEDFIEGIKPCGMDNNGNLKFSIVNGVFKDFCISALNDPNKEYYFIADEINRANLSNVFGETLSLLENDYRFDKDNPKTYSNTCSTPLSNVIKNMYEASIESDKKNIEKLIFYKDSNNNIKFGIPKNVHFIGMMNDVDRSIDTFDLALRRRFVWIRKEFDEYPIESYLLENNVKSDAINKYISKCKQLNYYITGTKYKGIDTKGINPINLGKSFELGHAIFMKIKVTNNKINKQAYEDLWYMHIETTLKEYLRSSLSDIDIEDKLKEAKDIFITNNEKA